MRLPALVGCLLLAAGLLVAGCGPRVDLKQALQVTEVSTGWFDAGIVDGKNKLVPSVSFRLTNTADAEVDYVALNVAFRYATTDEIHEEVFKQRVPFENKQSELIVVRSQNGHVGEPPQSRQEMLQNSNFTDMVAVILARQSASRWVELHRIPVERTLLTR